MSILIGNFELDREKVSIGLMILFALLAMFFFGYQYAYTKAVTYANVQIEEKVNDFMVERGMIGMSNNYNSTLNIKLPSLEGINNEKR